MAQLGENIAKYQISQVLGQGAMGVVYLALDPVIERQVAIKVLHAHHCQGPNGKELSQRFQREAQAAARCLHPNIVTVFDYGDYQDQNYLVMEYIEGEELSDLLHSDHKLSVDEAVFITQCVLRGLHAAHQNKIVHRDIKPANIILLNNGDVKIADFGVALLDQSDLTLSGNMVGTPNYMAPEGLRGETVTHQADIYSTAMVMLEMLTSARLSPQQLYTLPITTFLDQVFAEHSYITPAMQQVLRKALSAETTERYLTALDFSQAIDQLNNNAVKSSPPEQVQSPTPITPPDTLIQQAPVPGKIKIARNALQDIENKLTKHLGPIASLVIKKTLTSSENPEQFMLSLAKHIVDLKEREQFIDKARSSLAITTVPNSIPDGSTPPQSSEPSSQIVGNLELSPQMMEKVSTQLAYFLGPVAKHQVKRQAKRCANLETLYQQLAALISTAEDRNKFLESMAKE